MILVIINHPSRLAYSFKQALFYFGWEMTRHTSSNRPLFEPHCRINHVTQMWPASPSGKCILGSLWHILLTHAQNRLLTLKIWLSAKQIWFGQKNPDELTTISIIRVYNYRWKYNLWQVVTIVCALLGHYLHP